MTQIKQRESLARELIQGELFDLLLYRRLLTRAHGSLDALLGKLIPVEEGHLALWKKFFGLQNAPSTLGFWLRVKLTLIDVACRLFGDKAVHIVLEAIEVHGVRKYLAVWEEYQNDPLGSALREVLEDEFHHEEEIVSQQEAHKVNPERIRNIFLGLNDGLVEILGAVSGLFAAFNQRTAVLAAGCTLAIAGALSMAASVFASSHSEREMQTLERRKGKVLGTDLTAKETPEGLFSSALLVAISYLAGAIVPLLPVLAGAAGPLFSLLFAALIVVIVSAILSFLSGMEFKKRVLINLIAIGLSVAVTFGIGTAVKHLWGISL